VHLCPRTTKLAEKEINIRSFEWPSKDK
jgi:hypothetical protein